MRFFGRGNDEEEEEFEEGAEGGEEQEGAAEGEGDQDAEPPDPELQAKIDAAAQKLADAQIGQIREAARKRGLDWTGQDFGVTDYTRAAQAFGLTEREPRQQAPQQPAAEAEDAEPELEAYDVDSLKAHTAWQVRQATKAAQDENAQLRAMLAEDRMSRAMERVDEAVKRYAIPAVAEYLEHPEFEEAFRQSLATQNPALWGSAKNLAAVASLVAMDLDREQLPAKKEPESPRNPRPTAGEQQRRQLEQMSPTRDAGQPMEGAYTREDRAAVRVGLVPNLEMARFHRENPDANHEEWQAAKARLVKNGARR